MTTTAPVTPKQNTNMRKIILASASERRADIMKLSGIAFDVKPSNYEEDLTLKLPPRKLAEKLALGKALAVSATQRDAVVIGADTFVLLGRTIMGKPGTVERAKEMLKALSGKKHTVLTGFALVDTKSGRRKSGVEETTVWFKKLSPREIDTYVREGKPSPLGLAGAYAIQAQAAKFVTKIEGDYFNIVGLPISRIASELQAFGVLP